jgi:hypothetical protein
VTRKEMLFEDWISLQPIKEIPEDWRSYTLTPHQAGLKRTLEQEQAWNRHQEEARLEQDCRRLERQAQQDRAARESKFQFMMAFSKMAKFVSPPREPLYKTTQQHGFFSQLLEKKTEVEAQSPTSRLTNQGPSTEDHKVPQESSPAAHDHGLPTPQTEPQTGHGWTYDPDPQGRRRGILTDRPPDKPPRCKGRFRGNSLGRANSPAQESRSSLLCACTSLRGVAAPLDTIHLIWAHQAQGRKTRKGWWRMCEIGHPVRR